MLKIPSLFLALTLCSWSLFAANYNFSKKLERLDHSEYLTATQIVGVFKGKVSLKTASADKAMVISLEPAETTNKIALNKQQFYENIAFIGEVPVQVKGKVNTGDYIIASGSNDGTGIAVPPDKLMLKDLTQLVGQCWESSDEEMVKLVNVIINSQSDIFAQLILKLNTDLQQLQIQQKKTYESGFFYKLRHWFMLKRRIRDATSLQN